jgi:short-subunit dehydrogenase
MPRRAIYGGSLAYIVAMSQTLHAELDGTGVNVHVACPGIVATEFHEVQGIDLSAIPRMSAEDVVTAALAGIELGEVVSAPGVEDDSLIDTVFAADLAAFAAQSPQLATRYRASLDRLYAYRGARSDPRALGCRPRASDRHRPAGR